MIKLSIFFDTSFKLNGPNFQSNCFDFSNFDKKLGSQPETIVHRNSYHQVQMDQTQTSQKDHGINGQMLRIY